MKHSILKWGLLCAVLPLSLCAQRQEIREKISKKMLFEQFDAESTLVVQNIFGSVSVEGYNGDALLFEVEKIVKADSQDDMEFGKKELQVKFVNKGSKIIVYPDAPYMNFDEEGRRFYCCNDGQQEPAYRHELNFVIKVPQNIKLHLSTVNDGDITVRNMRGAMVKVSNVNGGIALEGIAGETDLNSINGKVSVRYSENPPKSSRYYSLNGDINISCPSSLSAEVSFKTMNGELFTDFDIERQFTATKRTENRDKAKFKYEAMPKLQIGSGAVALDFETLNGNVYLKKI